MRIIKFRPALDRFGLIHRGVICWLIAAFALGGTHPRGSASGAEAGAGVAAPGRQASPRINVVLILADDLGWADLGCYGADLHETPRLDRFAGTALRFTSAYAASVCTPTRASLMTGKHSARLHMTTWLENALEAPGGNRPLLPPQAVGNLPLGETTLAELFQAAGYRTALVGKWHLGDARHYPEAQGFDVNIGGTLWGAPRSYFFPYRGAVDSREYRYIPHLEHGVAGEYLTDRLTDEALALIDRWTEEPFFLYLAHHAPHTPLEAKADRVAHYRAKIASNPGLRHTNPTYAAMVQSLDEGVGRILDRLDARGLLDRTVVIFTSDNGGAVHEYDHAPITSNAPLRSGKGSLYEGGVRVPLIVRWPGLTRPASISDEPVALGDLFPTVRTLVQADPLPPGIDGVDLAPVLRDPSARLPREALYFHFPHYYFTTTPVSAVRSGEWKLLRYHETRASELYNLRDDPGEREDVAGRFPERAALLETRLMSWLSDIQAQLPSANPKRVP